MTKTTLSGNSLTISSKSIYCIHFIYFLFMRESRSGVRRGRVRVDMISYCD